MRVIFACGGTAGHINPALAVADTLKHQVEDLEILFVGNPNRMESVLVPEAGYAFAPLEVEGFHRSFSPSSIVHNLKSFAYMLTAGRKVKKIIREFQPEIVMGTGGYVSGPVLRTAAKMGIKTITHESNAYPGMTTKLLVGYVDKILLAVKEAEDYLPAGRNYIVTGNPVRPQILKADRAAARKALGVEAKFVVLSYGGSGGATKINDSVAKMIKLMEAKADFYLIHSTGKNRYNDFRAEAKVLGADLSSNNLDIRSYIDNMDQCVAAADLLITRGGAMTLTEIQVVGRASILIPSPNVAENHQYHNAMVLANHNAAIVVEEKDLNGELLTEYIVDLMNDRQELENIARNAKTMGITDGNLRIVSEIISLYNEDRKQ